VPHRLATGLPIQNQWFMQDGARPHTANVVLDFLHDTFDSLSSQTENWPPNSPDLNTCNYFLWGFFMETIFLKKPRKIMELRALIIEVSNEITEDMCRRVINNVTVRIEEVARRNGGGIEH
jgi:hypothetical protein